ncbi:MAG: hypothetical protein NT169_06025 [Chloroflexi bacterium]|nr:hypothetical protein [Chloroflexota bacterium]
MSETQYAVELHIEELVLRGFPPEQRQAIAAAVETALAGLLAERGVPPAWAGGGEAPRVDGGQFVVTPAARPEAIGAQVAQAVYGGLARRD